MRRGVVVPFLLIPLLACGGANHNPVKPDVSDTSATPATPAAVTPSPTPPSAPAPEVSPPEPNRPPRISLAFDGPSGCHPRRAASGVVPCTVSLVAEAKDPDGDPITLSWSGCASGSQAQAACTIDGPGSFVATLEVRDSHGASARASLTAQGVNGPPSATLSASPPFTVGHFVGIYGGVRDADDGYVCGRSWCVRAQASGACGPAAFLECTCLEDLYAEVTPTAAGTCTVTVTLRDDWGLEGTSTVRFEVTAP